MKHAVIIEIAFAAILALTGAVVMAPPKPEPMVSTPICSGAACGGGDPLEIEALSSNGQQESDNGHTRPF